MNEQVFLSVSRTELSEIIANAVAGLLSDFTQEKKSEPKYLKTDEASKYIGKSANALRQIVYRGEIPSIKRGINIYFLKEDLDTWMESGMRGKEQKCDPVESLMPLKKKGVKSHG